MRRGIKKKPGKDPRGDGKFTPRGGKAKWLWTSIKK